MLLSSSVAKKGSVSGSCSSVIVSEECRKRLRVGISLWSILCITTKHCIFRWNIIVSPYKEVRVKGPSQIRAKLSLSYLPIL